MEAEMSVAEVLRGAADYLEKHGWTPNHSSSWAWKKRARPCCAYEAMQFASEPAPAEPWALGLRAHDYFTEYIGAPTGKWNDIQTSKATVIRALRSAAASFEARERGRA